MIQKIDVGLKIIRGFMIQTLMWDSKLLDRDRYSKIQSDTQGLETHD